MLKISRFFKGQSFKTAKIYNKIIYDMAISRKHNREKEKISLNRKNLFKNDIFKIYKNAYFKRLQEKYRVNDAAIFESFFSPEFLNYMNSTYCLMPFLFSSQIINAVKIILFKLLFLYILVSRPFHFSNGVSGLCRTMVFQKFNRGK
jgi:hypothetical protein